MTRLVEIKVPDIGDFKDVGIIEILVKPGDTIQKETSLITVESDKATMEIPSPSAGVVKEIKVKLGDRISEGAILLTLLEEDQGPQPVSGNIAAIAPAAPDPSASAPAAAAPTGAPADLE